MGLTGLNWTPFVTQILLTLMDRFLVQGCSQKTLPALYFPCPESSSNIAHRCAASPVLTGGTQSGRGAWYSTVQYSTVQLTCVDGGHAVWQGGVVLVAGAAQHRLGQLAGGEHEASLHMVMVSSN